MELNLMKALIENSDIANDGLETLRMTLESLSDMDLGKLVREMRNVCVGETQLKRTEQLNKPAVIPAVCPNCANNKYHLGYYKLLMICEYCGYTERAN